MTLRRTDYLDHMAEAARLATAYVEGMSRSDFHADQRTQQAVIFNLMVIGEAAAKLMSEHAEFLARHPGVPWASMKGMRNRIAHGYFEIDIDVVWDTVMSALPLLSSALPAVRADSEANSFSS